VQGPPRELYQSVQDVKQVLYHSIMEVFKQMVDQTINPGLYNGCPNNLSKRLIIQHINEYKNGLSIDYNQSMDLSTYNFF
jgi:hypothetical protein